MLTAASVNLHELFGAGGSLADCLADFAPRPEQLAMAEEVSDAIRDGHNLVLEAGTGTGKTLAYLIPALLSGQRVIISTGTRTLQDQLFHRDLPMVGRAILVSASFAFAISMGEFGATAVIARPEFPTIPTMIFKLLGQPGASNYGQAMALSTLLMLVSGAGIFAIEHLRIAEVGEF